MFALAGVQLGEQGHRCGSSPEQAAFVLGLKAAVLQRFPVLNAADAHNHAHGVLDDLFAFVLAVGAVLPEGGDGGHN